MSLHRFAASAFALVFCLWLVPNPASAKTAEEIEASVNAALKQLLQTNPAASELSQKAKGILVFPDVTKAGLIVGAAHGVGALRVGGQTIGYYQTNTASLGLQAGVESRNEVLMFMTESALNAFKSSENWEAGIGGSVAVIDAGGGGDVTTKTTQSPIIGYIFGNSGLFAGLNFEGAKISPYTPEK